MLKWTIRVGVVRKRRVGTWVDLVPEHLPTNSQEFTADYHDALQQSFQVDMATAYEPWTASGVRRHQAVFPISENRFARMVTVQADFGEQQRERLTSALSLKGTKLPAYAFELVKDCTVELFCEPRSSRENPAYRVSGGQARTFAVWEPREIDGWSGYWVECEETGEERLIAELDECFWTYDEEGCFWNNRQAPCKKLSKRRSKGKGKKHPGYKGAGTGGGKGKQGLQFLNPFGKPKGNALRGNQQGEMRSEKGKASKGQVGKQKRS